MPRKLTRDDLSKIDLIFQYLDGIVTYNDEMVENIIISIGSNDGAPLVSVQDIRDQFEFEDIAQSLLALCEILIYIDNPEKQWTVIDPEMLDTFMQQIQIYHEAKKG